MRFSASSVGEARAALAHELSAAGVSRRAADDAVLVLSEILSNALKHARPLPSGRLDVAWDTADGQVQVRVTDGGGPTRPRAAPAPASASATGGRGLSIVRELSRDWGVSDEAVGTTVWAVLPGEPTISLLESQRAGRS